MSWSFYYGIDVLALLVFLFSYYRNCYRKGYWIDFWYIQLFLICVLPNLILLPFGRDELNALVLHRDFAKVVAVLPRVFLITLLGYAAVFAGGSLWQIRIGLGLRRSAMKLLDVIPRSSRMLMKSRSVLVFQALLCFFLQLGILAVYFASNGFGFDLRDYTFAHPELRPIAVAISSYSVVIASHCLARYVDLREKVLLACTLSLSIGLVFFGARSNLLGIFLNVFICYLVRARRKVKFVRVVGLLAFILVIGLYLGSVRAGEYSISDFASALVVILFYGNNFSDLRDFSWIYANWDHQLWAGKTYLAALTAFVPRFASTFRDTWVLGAATDNTVGLDPQMHPGLRPGLFGEGFFNFGLIGVLGVGLIIGIMLRRIDIDTKKALSSSKPSIRNAFASTMLLSLLASIAVSANFSSLYVLGIIYLFSWCCLSVQRMIFRSKDSPLDAAPRGA